MKNSKVIIPMLLLFIIALSTISNAQVAIIANKSVSESSIDKATLLNIYLLKSSNLGGTKVKLFDYSSDNNAKAGFLSAIGQSALDLKKAWLKAKLTGKGNPPDQVGSEDEMLNKVGSTPGAVGFVSSSKVNDNVKVLATF